MMNVLNKTSMITALLMLATAALPAIAADVRIERLEVEDNVYTPYYRVDTGRENDRPGVKKWIRLGVHYASGEDWTDALTIRYLAYAPGNNERKTLLFTRDVTYLNIGPGEHIGYAYLHPCYTERYDLDAYDLDFSVQILPGSRGNSSAVITPLATKETTKHSKEGWSALKGDAEETGRLLNRSETPFWFIDYDNRELIDTGM